MSGKVSAKNSVILINGYLFSTYATAWSSEATVGALDATGFGDGSKNFIPGLATAKMSLDMLWDSDTDKVHAALGTPATGLVTLIPEGYTLGARTINLPFMQSNYSPQGKPDGILSVGNLALESYGVNVGIENGVALAHGSIIDTTTGTGVLDPTNAAVTAACWGTLHCYGTPLAADTYTVVIEHSTAASTGYATLMTFTLTGAARGAERITVASGTINKYRRVVATRTGSAGNSFGFSVSFAHG